MAVEDSKIITQDISILHKSPDNDMFMGHFLIENTSTGVVTDVVAASCVPGLKDVTPIKVACLQASLESGEGTHKQMFGWWFGWSDTGMVLRSDRQAGGMVSRMVGRMGVRESGRAVGRAVGRIGG